MCEIVSFWNVHLGHAEDAIFRIANLTPTREIPTKYLQINNRFKSNLAFPIQLPRSRFRLWPNFNDSKNICDSFWLLKFRFNKSHICFKVQENEIGILQGCESRSHAQTQRVTNSAHAKSHIITLNLRSNFSQNSVSYETFQVDRIMHS